MSEPATGRALRLLAAIPLLDRLELAAVGALSEGSAHAALRRLEREGLAEAVRHAGTLTASTRRWLLTREGLRRLMRDEGLGERALLRAYPVSARWRRVLLERLDAAAVVYRLATALAGAGAIGRFRWYRGHPLDAAIELADGRTVGVIRLGATAEWTAFSERIGRLAQGASRGEARPRALLALVPDEVRLRRVAALLARLPGPAFLALEAEAAAAGEREAVWRAASSPAPVGLGAALAAVRPGGGLPAGRPEARPALPDDLDAGSPADQLLPAVLKPGEKRALDVIADWPWIAPGDLAALLGVSASHLSRVVSRLEELALVVGVPLSGRRLALSDRALALLARRDRASVALARRRWNAEPAGVAEGDAWRAIAGTRSRQLARHIDHTAGVHWFLARLAEQARREDWRVAQLDPPHRAARYFRYGGALRSVHPDAFGVLWRGDVVWPFFLEWERRALHPSTMAARLAPYLRYYATDRPAADHGTMPGVLVVFDDPVAPVHFLRIAREEIARSGIDLPLWVASRDELDAAKPLGDARRDPVASAVVDRLGDRAAFSFVARSNPVLTRNRPLPPILTLFDHASSRCTASSADMTTTR